MTQELKQSPEYAENKEVDQKYEDDSEDYANHEVIVNDHDLRIKVTKSDDKNENIMKCLGHIETNYIYDSKGGYRKSTGGTGTVFYVGSNGETFIVTCAHNVRTSVWECETCGMYMDEKAAHGKCDVNDLKQTVIKANKMNFFQRSIHKKYEKPIDDTKNEIIEYGDIENVYECDVDNIFINDKMYSLYPTATSGYDLCVAKFINQTNDFKDFVKNIRLKNGRKTIEKIGYFNIWGFAADKVKNINGKNEQEGLYGMKSHKNGMFSFRKNKTTKKMYFRQNTVDAYAGQSGASIWVKTKEKYLMGWAECNVNVICGVHTGGNSKKKHNVGVLFNDHILKKIDNFIKNKPFWFGDKFDKNNIGIHHALNGNIISCYGYSSDGWTSFLSTECASGMHVWKFKIKSKTCTDIVLGIWKTKSGNPQTDADFTDNNNGYGYYVGYGRDHKHKLYGVKCKENDVISMSLDLCDDSLSFSVNEKDCGKMCAVEKESYRAAVHMFDNDNSLEFLSYVSL